MVRIIYIYIYIYIINEKKLSEMSGIECTFIIFQHISTEPDIILLHTEGSQLPYLMKIVQAN